MRPLMRDSLLVLTLTLIGSQGAFAFQAPDEPSFSTFVGVRFPDEAAGFVATQATRYPDPSFGVGLAYASERARVDITVYVYPIGSQRGDDVVAAEFDRAWQELQDYTKSQREGVELELGTVEPWETSVPEGVRFVGRRGEGTLRMGSSALSTWLYVFAKDDSYIKYRITLERASRRLLGPDLEAFVASTLENIEGPPGG